MSFEIAPVLQSLGIFIGRPFSVVIASDLFDIVNETKITMFLYKQCS